jgi:hypothetical protein
MMMEKSVELLVGETEVLGENLPQCRFVHHKPHMLPGREPGQPRLEARDKPLELRHGQAQYCYLSLVIDNRNLTAVKLRKKWVSLMDV